MKNLTVEISIPKLDDTLKLKAERRYKEGENSIYDNVFNINMEKSWVLHKEVRDIADRALLPIAGKMATPQDCLSTWIEFCGQQQFAKDEKYTYYWKDGSVYRLAYIPSAIINMQELEKEFEDWRKKQKLLGYRLPDKRLWPDNLLEKLSERQGYLDSLLFERDHLFEKTKPFFDQIKEKEKKMQRLKQPFKFGAIGQNTDVSPSGVLQGIDFQKVVLKNDELVIAEGRYKGLKVLDYREIIVPKYLRSKRLPDFPSKVEKIEI